MGEFFKDTGEFLDMLNFVRRQRADRAVTCIEMMGSMVNGEGREGNDWDIAMTRSDVRRNELWVNAAVGRRSGKEIDIFVIPSTPCKDQQLPQSFKKITSHRRVLWRRK